MVDAAPFRALRYDPTVVGEVRTTSAPAADDIDRFDYARHRTASPYTVLELLAPRAGDGFAAAAAALGRWLRTGVLTRDPKPALYAYEQRMPATARRPEHVQRGVLAAVRVEDGPPHQILPHEDVDPERLATRLERLAAVPVDLAPVFTVATALGAGALLASALERLPLVALTDEAGTEHRVVACDDPVEIAALRTALNDVPVLIADGHHRYAAAIAIGRRSGLADARVLMLIVDASYSHPLIRPVHRLVPALPQDWPDRLTPDFITVPGPADVDELLAARSAAPDGTIALRVPGAGFLAQPRDITRLRGLLPVTRSAAWRTLDTALVEEVLLPRLGIEAGTVRYRPDPAAVMEVEQRHAGCLVLVRPVPFATVLSLATAGERLPPKTTSFRPKPRTGLIMRPHDG